MKQIDISKMGENERKETVKEAKILEVLSHPNIVKFIEVFKTKTGKLCIVMDFADGNFPLLIICRRRSPKPDQGAARPRIQRVAGA